MFPLNFSKRILLNYCNFKMKRNIITINRLVYFTLYGIGVFFSLVINTNQSMAKEWTVGDCEDFIEEWQKLDEMGVASDSPTRDVYAQTYSISDCKNILRPSRINTRAETERLRREQNRIDDRNQYLDQDQNCLTYGRGTYNPATRSCQYPPK
jgi:hypothetical protein